MSAAAQDLLAAGVLLRTGPTGDIAAPGHGLFVADTRHLSRWVLTVDGVALRALTRTSGPYTAEAVLVPGGRRGADPAYAVFRTQAVDADGLAEEVRVVNHGTTALDVVLAYEVGADFADLFELRSDRDHAPRRGERSGGFADGALRLAYRRADFRRDTAVRADPPPDEGDGSTLSWKLRIPPGGASTVHSEVSTVDAVAPRPPAVVAARARRDAARLDAAGTPAWPALRKGLADLASLLIPGFDITAAGSPWFLTLFGRDSLLTALFAGPAAPWLAGATLRALAARQGRTVDPARIEEPGKIVHEVRTGELAHFGEVPYARYYGSVDATPLFLMLLAECGDDALAAELEPAARAAVDWMFEFGGLGSGGYLVYRTDGPGLVHQGWKDSARAVCFRSGAPAHGPIALCEVQGYAWAALRGTAGLARRVWGDPAYADRLDDAAARLSERFRTDFWMPADGFVALALDGDGRQVDALSSNPGHLLWVGMLDPSHGVEVGRRLVARDFWSGWGIRTLAGGQPAYHPVSYHNGGVWPHDTAIAVAGLARYGLRDEAARVAEGLLAAAAWRGDRLPEVITGYRRREGAGPVPYPHSCSPQAWAAAAPLLMARALHGPAPG